MAEPTYGAEDHKKAFEVYRRERNFNEVKRVCKINYITAHQWALETFRCPIGCQWHGWEKLIQAALDVNNLRMGLLKDGVVDPVVISDTIATHLGVPYVNEKKPVPLRIRNIVDIIVSDEEKIQHWEMIYCKAFFAATNIAVDYTSAQELSKSQSSLQMIYKQGLTPTSLSDAVRIMGEAQNQIDKLRIKFSVTSSGEQLKDVKKTLSLEELRNYKQIAESMKPEEIEKLRKAMKTDQ